MKGGLSMRAVITVLMVLVFAAGAVAAESAGGETLSNQDVIDLIKAGLAKDLVVQKIRTSDNTFDMSTKAMINLKNEGVSDEIIALMLTEFERRHHAKRSKVQLAVQHLASDRPEVRETALTRLRQYGPAATAELRRTLGTTRPELRAGAAAALGQLGDRESADLLRPLLIDQETEVRHAVAESLWQLRDEAALKMARKAVIGGLDPIDGYIRLLGFHKDAKSNGFIKIRLHEEDDALSRAQAAWALGEIGQAESRESLEHHLDKENESAADVRRAAALALGKLADPESVKPLMRACTVDPEIRAETFEALGQYSTLPVVTFLVKTLPRRLTAGETQAVISSLRKITHQDFGTDQKRWNEWLYDHGDEIGKEVGGEGALEEAGAGPAPDSTATTPVDTGDVPPPPPPSENPVASGTPRADDEGYRVVPHHAADEDEAVVPPPPPVDTEDLLPGTAPDPEGETTAPDTSTSVDASSPLLAQGSPEGGDAPPATWLRDMTPPWNRERAQETPRATIDEEPTPPIAVVAPDSHGQPAEDLAPLRGTPPAEDGREFLVAVPGVVSVLDQDETASAAARETPGSKGQAEPADPDRVVSEISKSVPPLSTDPLPQEERPATRVEAIPPSVGQDAVAQGAELSDSFRVDPEPERLRRPAPLPVRGEDEVPPVVIAKAEPEAVSHRSPVAAETATEPLRDLPQETVLTPVRERPESSPAVLVPEEQEAEVDPVPDVAPAHQVPTPRSALALRPEMPSMQPPSPLPLEGPSPVVAVTFDALPIDVAVPEPEAAGPQLDRRELARLTRPPAPRPSPAVLAQASTTRTPAVSPSTVRPTLPRAVQVPATPVEPPVSESPIVVREPAIRPKPQQPVVARQPQERKNGFMNRLFGPTERSSSSEEAPRRGMRFTTDSYYTDH